jgi:MFS family permease
MSSNASLVPDAAGTQRSRFTERLLVPAAFITTTGNAFQITAATILVYRAGHSTLSVGLLFIAVAIPQVAFSFPFGHLVDKLDRRMLSVASDLSSAAIAFALPVWLWLHGPTTVGAYVISLLLACSAALFMPASNALVKERVADARLGKFNSHFEIATNTGQLLASSAAGFLVMAFGTIPLFAFNAGTFVLSAVLTYLIGHKQPVATPAAAEAGPDAAAAPAAPPAAAVPRPVKRLAVLFANWNLGLMVANTILAVLILHTFHKGPWLIGVTDALAFAGFLIGASCYPLISPRISGLRLAVLGMLGNLVMFCLEPLNYIVLMCAILVAGFCFAQGRIAARTLLMRASPEDQVGRIFGGTQAIALGAGIAANLGLSLLADATRVPYAFWALAAVQGAIAIGAYLSLVKPMSAGEKRPGVLETSAA